MNPLGVIGDAAGAFGNAMQLAQSGDPSSALQAQQQAYQQAESISAQASIMQAQHDAMMSVIKAIAQ